MDLKGLATLGKVAGVAGISIGAAVLVLNSLIQGPIPGLPDESRSDIVRLAMIGAFGIAALGIIVWALVAKAGGRTIRAEAGRDAVAAGRDAFLNSRVTRRDGADTPSEEEPASVLAQGKRDAAAGGRDSGVNVVVTESGRSQQPAGANRAKPASGPSKRA